VPLSKFALKVVASMQSNLLVFPFRISTFWTVKIIPSPRPSQQRFWRGNLFCLAMRSGIFKCNIAIRGHDQFPSVLLNVRKISVGLMWYLCFVSCLCFDTNLERNTNIAITNLRRYLCFVPKVRCNNKEAQTGTAFSWRNVSCRRKIAASSRKKTTATGCISASMNGLIRSAENPGFFFERKVPLRRAENI